MPNAQGKPHHIIKSVFQVKYVLHRVAVIQRKHRGVVGINSKKPINIALRVISNVFAKAKMVVDTQGVKKLVGIGIRVLAIIYLHNLHKKTAAQLLGTVGVSIKVEAVA